MSRRILQVAAGVSLGLLVALLAVRPERGGAARPGEEFRLPAPLPAPDAELVSHTGATVRLSELRAGRTMALFFGYTSCPDVCPLTMAALGRALDLLGEDAEDVVGVLVTVDPERDTPERMADYLARFRPGFVGLTGAPDALAAAARGYLVTAAPSAAPPGEGAAPAGEGAAPPPPPADHRAHADHAGAAPPPGDYTVDHTGRVYVVQDGAVRMTFPPLTDATAMAAGLALLLDP
jgi:cytochrome oxidase Cu insertion factor (SCO1/SenC/PrrC family)